MAEILIKNKLKTISKILNMDFWDKNNSIGVVTYSVVPVNLDV